MGSFRRGIRIFRSQDVKNESRPSCLEKTYPIRIYFLICFFFFLWFFFNTFIRLDPNPLESHQVLRLFACQGAVPLKLQYCKKGEFAGPSACQITDIHSNQLINSSTHQLINSLPINSSSHQPILKSYSSIAL